ncbi:MAG TPA: hypothetical protein VKW76_08240 [Candidatus Binatia bacterium]|nr:hypothetical protein [Candidatus Binatia bacterium]
MMRLVGGWEYLSKVFPRQWFHDFVIANPGSWHLLNVPPLGGCVLPVVAGTWMCSALAADRPVRYVVRFAFLAVTLICLSALQHLLTDFSDYRDFTAIFALMVAGLFFVLVASRLPRMRRTVLFVYAAGVALFNYVDLGVLHGRLHATADYAWRSQAVMERLLAMVRSGEVSRLEVRRAMVVLDDFFPLEQFYLEALDHLGMKITVVRATPFCSGGNEVVKRSAEGCEGFLLVWHARQCRSPEPGRLPGVVGRAYGPICSDPKAEFTDRSATEVAVDAPHATFVRSW